MDTFTLAHIATGVSLIRVPTITDLKNDVATWREVYFAARREVLAAHGPSCEAARRFEPDLTLDDDEKDDDDF